MRNINLLTALAALCLFSFLSGCETPTKAYVKQHPELSPEHRKIISSGRIKFGDPVAGMTREQVRLVMGTDPDQFDSINGEDAWIWLKSKVVRMNADTGSDATSTARSPGEGKHEKKEDATDSNQTEIKPTKVTIFFKGDIATRAEFGGGSL